MKRLVLAAALLVSGYATSFAQQSDQQRVATSLPVVVNTQAENQDRLGRPSTPPANPEPLPKWSQVRAQDPSHSPGQVSLPEAPFVWLDGELYTTLPRSRLLIAVPGGGASGCFSMGLPKRIENMKEFLKKLDRLEPDQPREQKVPQVLY